jgi:hypothetical protein
MSNLPNYFNLDIADYVLTPKTRNNNMEKKFAVLCTSNFTHKTYEDAEKHAKRCAAQQNAYGGARFAIATAIATVEAPVPEAVITKL